MTREEALSQLQILTLEEFSKNIDTLNLSEKRVREFYDIATSRVSIHRFSQLDIQEFALKLIFQKSYDEFKRESHPYSTCETYEFSPAKNGQNLIKHGISFGEVVSYSKKFGTLLIPCPDSNDRERIIAFSDLDLENKYKLHLPLSEIKSTRYCLSIVKSINGKFRFISSRLLSSNKKKYTDTIHQSIRSVEFTNEASKHDFVARSVETLEQHLICNPA